MLGFDFVFIVLKLLLEFLGRWLCVEAYTNIKKLFSAIAEYRSTTDRRLQIDIISLREIYSQGKLSKQ